MKHFYYAVLLIFVVNFCSCKKEMNATPYPSANFEGKWTLKSQSLKQYRNNVIYNDVNTTESNGTFLQFNAGGTGLVGDNSGQTTVRWNVLEEIVTITKLYPNGQVLVSPYHIESFKGNQMVLKYEHEYEGQFDNQKYKDISVETYSK